MYSEPSNGLDYRILNFVLACVGGVIAVFIAIFVPPLRVQPGSEPVPIEIKATPGAASRITVYVSGAVKKGGVYALPGDSRLYAALQAAGGLLPQADGRNLNLARRLKDEEMVVVPAVSAGRPVLAANPPGRVNLNEASETDLAAFPGVGPSVARRIVGYRQTYGSFRSVDELQKVPGLKRRWNRLSQILSVP